jgi:hypothetical protein
MTKQSTMISETLHFHCPFENALCCAVIVKSPFCSYEPTLVVIKKIGPCGQVSEHFKYLPNDLSTTAAEDLVSLKIVSMNHWNYITPSHFNKMLPPQVGSVGVYRNE